MTIRRYEINRIYPKGSDGIRMVHLAKNILKMCEDNILEKDYYDISYNLGEMLRIHYHILNKDMFVAFDEKQHPFIVLFDPPLTRQLREVHFDEKLNKFYIEEEETKCIQMN